MSHHPNSVHNQVAMLWAMTATSVTTEIKNGMAVMYLSCTTYIWVVVHFTHIGGQPFGVAWAEMLSDMPDFQNALLVEALTVATEGQLFKSSGVLQHEVRQSSEGSDNRVDGIHSQFKALYTTKEEALAVPGIAEKILGLQERVTSDQAYEQFLAARAELNSLVDEGGQQTGPGVTPGGGDTESGGGASAEEGGATGSGGGMQPLNDPGLTTTPIQPLPPPVPLTAHLPNPILHTSRYPMYSSPHSLYVYYPCSLKVYYPCSLYEYPPAFHTTHQAPCTLYPIARTSYHATRVLHPLKLNSGHGQFDSPS